MSDLLTKNVGECYPGEYQVIVDDFYVKLSLHSSTESRWEH